MRPDAITPIEGMPPYKKEDLKCMILERYKFYAPEMRYDMSPIENILNKMNERDMIVFNSFISEILKVFTIDTIDFGIENSMYNKGAITLRFALHGTGITLGILHLDTTVGHFLRGSFAIPDYMKGGKCQMSPRQLEDWENEYETITDCYWRNFDHPTSGRTDAMGVCHAEENCITAWKQLAKWREKVIPNDIKTREKLKEIDKKLADLKAQREQITILHLQKIGKIADALEIKDNESDRKQYVHYH